MSIHVKRTSTMLTPDQSRVLLRPFNPGGGERIARIVNRILSLPEDQVGPLLDAVSAEFSLRHRHIRQLFLERFEQVRESLNGAKLSEPKRLLIGSYFLAEYSLESAALFNPSIVPHPDQTGLAAGDLRFILSLRATGEGHISSITFRTGVIHADQRIEVVPPAGFLTEPRQVPNPWYEKALFERKLAELGLTGEFTRRVMHSLGDSFALEELRTALQAEQFRLPDGMSPEEQHASQGIWMLARSNYEVRFQPEQQLSERIIFPVTPSQRNGIEDARFVCFQNDDGTHLYYATFTAFDGKVVLPELVETSDFPLSIHHLERSGCRKQRDGDLPPEESTASMRCSLDRTTRTSTLRFPTTSTSGMNARCSSNRRSRGNWSSLATAGPPSRPTLAGWSLATVSAPCESTRIGAFLLDRDDPAKVIGRLREPLLKPNQNEREGYVPNVVYTCGALLHRNELIIPYGLADHATSFATVRT